MRLNNLTGFLLLCGFCWAIPMCTRPKNEIDELKYNIDQNQVSKKLLHATAEERNKYEISPSNYGIHWSMIDEDLSIERLLKTKI